MIRAEFELVQKGLAELFSEPLAERRPRFRYTVERRVKPLRVLHRRQVELLQRWRQAEAAGDASSEAVLGEVRQTIAAIAAGLRTTG